MIYVHTVIAQRGTSQMVALYRPFIETVTFTDGTPQEKIDSVLAERMKSSASFLGWGDNYYHEVFSGDPFYALFGFGVRVKEEEWKRVHSPQRYQVCLSMVVDDEPFDIEGKIYDNRNECEEAVEELNSIAAKNGMSAHYFIRCL